jgi:hypothetical protein
MAVVHRAILDERHRRRQAIVADVVASRLGSLIATMHDLSQEALVAYVEQAYPVVAGGQTVAADTAAAYSRALAAGRRPKRPVDVAGALAKSGKLVTPDSRSLVAPILRARHLAAEGEQAASVVVTAANYAAQLSAADLQAAMRVGVDEGATASGLETQGWSKGLGPEPCEWCISIADNVYGDPDSIPYHDGDRCGVEPVLDDQAPARFDDSDIPF